MKSRLLSWIEYIPIRIILSIVNLLPYKTAVKVGAGFGKLIYYIPPLKRVVFEGLNIAFSDKMNEKEIKKLAKKVFKNFGKLCFEIMKMLKFKESDIEKYVVRENKEQFLDDFNKGKGHILICGHISNWELMGAGWSKAGIDADVIVRPLDNPLLDNYIENMRKKFGLSIIPRNESGKKGIKALRNKKALVFLMDQNTVKNPLFVDFFGKPASVVRGPATFAYKFKCPVGLAYSIREDNKTHRLYYRRIEMDYTITDREKFIQKHTLKFTKEIENVIKENPGQWLWLHPRWKTRPPDEL